MVAGTLGVLAVAGGIAIRLDLGGIASNYGRFERSTEDAVDSALSRVKAA